MEKAKSKVRYSKVFFDIIKKSKIIYIFAVFVLLYFVLSLAIFYADRHAFGNYGDALWFSFVSMFTIGYGDFNVTTTISRILTAILVVYATVIIAIFTAVWACIIGVVVKDTIKKDEKEIKKDDDIKKATLSDGQNNS